MDPPLTGAHYGFLQAFDRMLSAQVRRDTDAERDALRAMGVMVDLMRVDADVVRRVDRRSPYPAVHARWHTKRGLRSDDCEFCRADLAAAA